MVAARKIGAADGFVKQHVAGHQQAGFGAVKHNVAGGVAGDVQHLETVAADAQAVVFRQPLLRLESGRHRKAVFAGDDGQLFEQEAVVRMRAEHRHRPQAHQLVGAGGVVEMAVGEPHGFEYQAAAVDFCQKLRHVAANVGEYGFAAFVVPQQGAVLAEGGNGGNVKM